jgi:AAA domain-containing protein
MTALSVPLFERIRRGKNPGPRRTMLYGVQGVGKSTWASMAPGTIFLPTEDGLRDIDCASFPLLKRFSDVMSALRDLEKNPHDYETVVVDSLDWLEQIVWDHVCQENQQPSIEAFGYGKGYTMAIQPWRQFLDALDILRGLRGMSVILLAHAKIERFEAPETQSYDRYTPRLHKTAAGLIQEWCDEVFFACYLTMTRVEKGKFNKETVKAVGDGQRIMRTAERPFAMAKNRLGLPHELPLDYRKYAEILATTNGRV